MNEIYGKPPEMLPIKEVASKTGLSYYYIRQLCLNEEIIFIRAGNKYLINYDRFIDYLNGNDNRPSLRENIRLIPMQGGGEGYE